LSLSGMSSRMSTASNMVSHAAGNWVRTQGLLVPCRTGQTHTHTTPTQERPQRMVQPPGKDFSSKTLELGRDVLPNESVCVLL
jgi:hypothetical protein